MFLFPFFCSLLSSALVWSNKRLTACTVCIKSAESSPVYQEHIKGEDHMEMCSLWILTMHVCQEHFNPNLLVTGTQLEGIEGRED